MIGRAVRAEHVALVDRHPRLFAVRFERQAVGVAQYPGIDANCLGLGKDLQDNGARRVCVA